MDFDAEIPMPGKFSVYNALCAIAICRHFKVTEENMKQALKAARKSASGESPKVSSSQVWPSSTCAQWASSRLAIPILHCRNSFALQAKYSSKEA